MQSISNDNFGLLIAYLVPGATVLSALSPFSLTLQSWFATMPSGAPTIGGFLYLTVASVSAGMIVSAVRWATVDTGLRLSGIKAPALDFAGLGGNYEAFLLLIEIHYRHYQFYANMFVATVIAYVSYRVRAGYAGLGWLDLTVLGIEIVFAAAARDTLAKYYARTEQLLPDRRTIAPRRRQ
jgi:hypothetical protein